MLGDVIIASFIGITAGFISVFFHFALHSASHFVHHTIETWLAHYSPFLLVLVPALGGLCLLPFALRYPSEIHGFGMPRFLMNIHFRGATLKIRNIPIKIITSILTIATGGSAGVEGPIAQIGGTVGSVTGSFFKAGTNRVKMLIACGVAASIGAQFNAPIAGVLFAQEIVIIQPLQMNTFAMIVISSGIGTAISRIYYSSAPLFGSVTYSFHSYYELALYSILGIIIGIIAFIFIRFYYFTEGFFTKLPINKHLKPVIGGLCVGCIGLIHHSAIGEGYDVIHAALSSPMKFTASVFFLLIILKIIATSITLGSGGVGGMFAPSLVIGATIGAAFGASINMFFPAWHITPESYALVGMGSFLAAATHAPMTAIFLLFEITNNYVVILPIMFSSVIGLIIASHFCPESLDTYGLAKQGIHLHGEKIEHLLADKTITSLIHDDFHVMPENTTLREFISILSNSQYEYYPCVDHNQELTGMLSFRHVRQILFHEKYLGDLCILKEIVSPDLVYFLPNVSLKKAVQVFQLKEFAVIPVVDSIENKRVIGLVHHKEVIKEYNRTLLLHQTHVAQV